MSEVENKKYCMVTFMYEGTKPTLRYIPFEEMKDCYFPICYHVGCPNLQKHHIHPWGIKGCPKNALKNNICRGDNCDTSLVHLFGQHKKCEFSKKDRYHNEKLPIFVGEHTVGVIPENEYVYHFDKDKFNQDLFM